MVGSEVVKRSGFRLFGGEVLVPEAGGPLDVALLFTLGIFGAAVAGDNQLGRKAVDLVLETVESDSRHLNFKDAATHALELPLVMIEIGGSDRGHTGVETAGSMRIGSNEEIEKIHHLAVGPELECHDRAAHTTVNFFEGNFQGFLTFT